MRTGALFDDKAPRRAVNLSLNSDLVAKARSCGLNLSGIAEEAIRREIARVARERFKAEIRRSVEQHDAYLAEYGSFADAIVDEDAVTTALDAIFRGYPIGPPIA